jgi:hypothetical protein
MERSDTNKEADPERVRPLVSLAPPPSKRSAGLIREDRPFCCPNRGHVLSPFLRASCDAVVTSGNAYRFETYMVNLRLRAARSPSSTSPRQWMVPRSIGF